jgi:hypothetical protein
VRAISAPKDSKESGKKEKAGIEPAFVFTHP